MRVTGALRLVLCSSLLAACGGGSDLLLPGSGEPASVTLLQGDLQNGRVGDTLPQPLLAAVEDGNRRPVEGATVVFVLTDAATGASVDPDTTTTDAEGHATAQVVLGTRPGPQTGQVQALGGTGAPTATADFSLTAVSENANGIRAVSGEDQSGQVGAALPNPLVVEVDDAFGNPIAGVDVAWTVEGGGNVSAGITTTGQDGQTSVTRTLGSAAGTQRTLATVPGLAGSPVAFVHRATAGAASGVTIVSGDDQIGPVSTELPLPLVVEVRDAQANVVPSVAVTWVIGTGGGSVTPTTSATDGSGRATAAWTLGNVPGPNTVTAVVSGIGVGEFSATATAGAPARLVVRTQPASSAVSGAVLGTQPVVQLIDAQGNDAAQGNVEVRVTIGSGGGTLGGTTARLTDGSGKATFNDLAIVGAPGTRTLKFAANGFASVTSAQINLTAASTVTTLVSHSPDPSRAGEQITVQFTVSSPSGTPTGSVQVSDGVNACTGDLQSGSGSCTVALATVGSRTLTATYAGAGGFAPSSDSKTHTVEATPSPMLALAQQPSAQATSGAAFGQQPVIQLQTGDGGTLTTANVSVTVTILSGGGTLSGTVTQVTDGQGRAQFTDLAISGDPGQRTLRFTATGYTDATSSAIDVQPAPPSGSTSSVTASPTSISAGATSTVTVTVRDAGNNALAGRTVTVNGGTDPSVSPGSATTGADGTATFTFTSSAPETKTLTAQSGGVTLGSATVTVM